MQIRSQIVAVDLHAGTRLLKALKARIFIAAHKQTFSIMHIDVSRPYFHANAQRLVLEAPTLGKLDE